MLLVRHRFGKALAQPLQAFATGNLIVELLQAHAASRDQTVRNGAFPQRMIARVDHFEFAGD